MGSQKHSIRNLEAPCRRCAIVGVALFAAGIPLAFLAARLAGPPAGLLCCCAIETLALAFGLKGWHHKGALVAVLGALAVLGCAIVTAAFFLPLAAARFQENHPEAPSASADLGP